MNKQMAINTHLSTIKSKKQTKQKSRTETESEIWRSFGGLSAQGQRGTMGEKVQELRSTNW